MEKIRLLLADDHNVLRAGLRHLLNAQADMEVVAEAADGHEAVQAAAEFAPDVVLMDLSMPGIGGIDATRRIKAALPATKVLVLMMHDDSGYLREALSAGASGLVLKQAADTELLSAIRTVHAGRAMVFAGPSFEPSQGGALPWPRERAEGDRHEGLALLSEREKDVVRLLALGHTNQEIGAMLFISVKTVDSHRSRIMEKLGLTRRADLVRFAVENGLFPYPR